MERYSLTSLDEVAETFGVAVPDGSAPRFNIAPMQSSLIRTAAALAPARWGLLPPWRGHGGKRGPHVLRAPMELVDATPLLRNAFKSQRCLVVADGYFVWHHTEKKIVPVWMHPTPDPARPHARSRPVGFAAVAATHRDDGQLSFAILIGPTNPQLAALDPTVAPRPAELRPHAAPIDSTAPIIIPTAHHAAWLTGPREQARALLALATPGWRADLVSTWVNSIDHDDERCVTPLRNPAQGELF